jgi:predicted phosphohydrolase
MVSLLDAIIPPPPSPFLPPSLIYSILHYPIYTFLSPIHHLLTTLQYPIPSVSAKTPAAKDSIRLVLLSDTHTFTPDIPDGDILIHAGDLSNTGSAADIQAQLSYLARQPHAHKFVIAGNHDLFFDPRSRLAEDVGSNAALDYQGGLKYLQHSGATVAVRGREVRIYGAPQTPNPSPDRWAFEHTLEQDAWTETLSKEGVIDVLVTHTPPRWHRDLPPGVGDPYLLSECYRVRPRVHVCGHVHAGRGMEVLLWDSPQRAWERLRAGEIKWGWMSFLWPAVWVDLARVILGGVMGVVWRRVWGGDDIGPTVLVNAGVMDWKTSKANLDVKVVDI